MNCGGVRGCHWSAPKQSVSLFTPQPARRVGPNFYITNQYLIQFPSQLSNPVIFFSATDRFWLCCTESNYPRQLGKLSALSSAAIRQSHFPRALRNVFGHERSRIVSRSFHFSFVDLSAARPSMKRL